jgi:D-alanyl-D-alanine carboxypeptidase
MTIALTFTGVHTYATTRGATSGTTNVNISQDSNPFLLMPQSYQIKAKSLHVFNATPINLQSILNEAVNSTDAKTGKITGIPLTFQCNGFNNNQPISYVSGKIRENADTLPDDALFQVGSITKSFVAVVTLKIITDPQYKQYFTKGLDSTVGDILGNPKSTSLKPWNESWNYITLRQLLNMTSGISDYANDNIDILDKLSKEPYHQFDTTEILASVVTKPLKFEPGHGWAYSNTNYVLVNKIISYVTQSTIRQQIIKYIIDNPKLNLKHTYFVENIPEDAITRADQKSLLMGGYYYFGSTSTQYLYNGVDIQQNNAPNKSYSLSWANAAGSIISSTADINTYARSLFADEDKGGLLTNLERRELMRFVATKDDVNKQFKAGDTITENQLNESTQGYGLGIGAYYLAIDLPDGKKSHAIFYSHSGGTLGFSSNWLYQPDRQASIVFDMNSTDYASYNKIMNEMYPQLLNKTFNECATN